MPPSPARSGSSDAWWTRFDSGGTEQMSAGNGAAVRSAEVYLLPVETRVPLKFGPETLTQVTCARVRLEIEGESGDRAVGWGETPLSVQWVWPSALPYSTRRETLVRFTLKLAEEWAGFDARGHPLDTGHRFQQHVLPRVLAELSGAPSEHAEPMPYLAALVCCSAFDLALHDAYGRLHLAPVYSLYGPPYMRHDLDHYLTPVAGSRVSFAGRYPCDFLVDPAPRSLLAWHLVGGLDPLDESELTGQEPDDGYPVTLGEWIRRDGLRCLKVKLRGTDANWDYRRLVRVGEEFRPQRSVPCRPVWLHASDASLVSTMSKGAIEVGANGLSVDALPDPKQARLDGAQSITPDTLGRLMEELVAVSEA